MKAADDLNNLTQVEEPIDGKTIIETYNGEEENVSDQELSKTESNEQNEDESSAEFNQDVDTARENLQEIIHTGGDALKEMQRIGQASDHPRAYEVLSTMMRTLVDANKAFVDISEKKKSGKKKASEAEGDGKVTNHNTLFVGNPQDAIDMINNSRNKDND